MLTFLVSLHQIRRASPPLIKSAALPFRGGFVLTTNGAAVFPSA